MLSIVKAQQEYANSLFKKMMVVDPNCILAGGAPRDWFFEKGAKDLDFYIYQPILTCGQRVIQLNNAGFEVENVGEDEPVSNYKNNKNIMNVFNVKGADFPVQIISLRIPAFEIVDTFPVSISKIWYRPDCNVRPTDDFILGNRMKSIFVTNEAYGRNGRYIQKIKDKFKEYKFYDSKESALFDFVNENNTPLKGN